ncbi:MAG: DNA polymerase III subunit delta [Tannerellaceae bacterium]|jgi:DNA polymerase-3 subunit delta'|nr:DNA polymerase III subunit delta [Tannerellaceae bacterium]
MYFRDVVGQDELKRQLIEAANRGFVPHAQMFVESGGAGAFPIALAYARYLNCTDRRPTDSCGRCPSCHKYDELAHPDLFFVFPMAKRERKKMICDDYMPEWRAFLSISPYFSFDGWTNHIEVGNTQPIIYSQESEEITRKLSYRIYESEYRILLIWMPEKMHLTCANKLLKLVEEPSENTLIFMVTDEPDTILGTILSRVQRINVRAIAAPELAEALVRIERLDPESARDVARMAEGNYLKAKELISVSDEHAFFLEQFREIMRNAWARNIKGMKTQSEKLAQIGRERQKNFLAYCQRLMRENFIYRFNAPELNYMNRQEADFAAKFSPHIYEHNVLAISEELTKAEVHIAQNVNAKMVFFDMALRITMLIRK